MDGFNAENYHIIVRRITVDEVPLYEARVKEFPDIHDFGETFQEAYDLAIETINAIAELYLETNRDMPKPNETSDFSGRITLRLPKGLHARLAFKAENEGVSLNQYLVSALSFHDGSSSNDYGWARIDGSLILENFGQRDIKKRVVNNNISSSTTAEVYDFNGYSEAS